jgi:hypothetical protein
MALVVEDGTGLEDAESYLSELDFELRAEALGLTLPVTGDAEVGLRRGTRYLEGRYAGRWPGYKINGRAQALNWPRRYVRDSHGNAVADDEVPEEIKKALVEAAYREMVEPDSLTPDHVPGQRVISESVGPISVTYADDSSAPQRPTVTIIDEILWPLLLPGGSGFAFLRRA